jgi:hypothetical protein
MAKKSDRADDCVVLHDRTGMYVVFHGVRIAKRGAPGTPQARTWLSLVPGYRVFDEYKGPALHGGRRGATAIRLIGTVGPARPQRDGNPVPLEPPPR